MSLLYSVHIRRHRKKSIPIEKNFVYTSALEFLDLPDFASIRDYFIREFASDKAMNSATMNFNKDKKERYAPKEFLYGSIPNEKASERIDRLIDVALFNGSGTYNGKASKELKQQFKDLIWDKFEVLFDDQKQAPYERVGALMNLFLDAAKAMSGTGVRLSHVHMRRWMTEQLSQFCCADLKRTPHLPAWDGLPSTVLGKITQDLNAKSPNAPLPLAFPRHDRAGERSVSHRTDRIYELYPKSADEFRHEASVRKEQLSTLSPGQHLLMTPWMENGFQMNAFSWRNFENFIQRYYVMTATESTFDKSFFCEWVTFGGNRWSKPEYKKKYEEVWEAAYLEWVAIAKVVIPNTPRLAVDFRMTSLPPELRVELAKEAVTRWPALAASKDTTGMLQKAREKDPQLDQQLKTSEKLVDIRESLGMLNKDGDHILPRASQNLNGSTEWSVYEHVSIRNAVVQPNVSVNIPDTLMHETDFNTK